MFEIVLVSTRVCVSLSGLFGLTEHTAHHRMVSLVWLKCQLLQRLQLVGLQLLHLSSEHSFRLGGRVDARRLDRDDIVTAILQEMMRIERNNTRLIGLCNVGEHAVDHSDQHAILVWMTGVFDDRNDVRSLLCDIDQIATGTMREFHSVDETLGTDNVADV